MDNLTNRMLGPGIFHPCLDSSGFTPSMSSLFEYCPIDRTPTHLFSPLRHGAYSRPVTSISYTAVIRFVPICVIVRDLGRTYHTLCMLILISVSLGLTYANGKDYASHPWPGFGVVIGTNILGTLVIITRRDVVWCVAAIWICISILVERPKPMPVYVRGKHYIPTVQVDTRRIR